MVDGGCHQAADDLRLVIGGGREQRPTNFPTAPALSSNAPKTIPGNTGLHRGSGAHGTRFQRDDEGAAVETPVAQLIGGFAQGHNRRVRIGVSPRRFAPADDGTGWIG